MAVPNPADAPRAGLAAWLTAPPRRTRLGARRVLQLWLAVYLLCLIANAGFGRWWRIAEPADFSNEATRMGGSLVRHGEFRDPFAPMPTGPTSHSGPGFPVLYAGILLVFGMGKATWWVTHLVVLAAYALSLAWLAPLAVEIGVPVQAGILGAVIGCLIPLPGGSYKWETLFVALFLGLTAYLMSRLREPKRQMRTAVLTGVLAGITLLFSPTVLLVFAAWGLLVLRSLRIQAILVMIALPALIISPWVIRDYRVFHALIFIRDNLGIEMAASHNDCASAWADDDRRTGCSELVHPNVNAQLAARVRELGEYRFNKERLHMAIEWIKAHRGRFAFFTLKRFLFFWFPVAAGGKYPLEVLGQFIVSLLTALSIPGLWLLFQTYRFAGQLLLTCLLAFPLTYYVVHVNLRYRYPILWVTCFGVGYLIVHLATQAQKRRAWAAGKK